MESGPFHFIECIRSDAVAALVRQYRIDTIYHLTAILSASAEKDPQKGWQVNLGGLYNAESDICAVLEAWPAMGGEAPAVLH